MNGKEVEAWVAARTKEAYISRGPIVVEARQFGSYDEPGRNQGSKTGAWW